MDDNLLRLRLHIPLSMLTKQICLLAAKFSGSK
ncbi:hypothetical protein WD_0409 [Wolbachia endosymbiont of Drosophila melanogaster]|nr:hypothetical protein WD_0409 [Wolbachia endosymbiont of Drosophila melanogaster]